MKQMKSKAQVLFCVCLASMVLGAGCMPGRNSAEREKGKLQGIWLLEYQQSNGKKLPDEKTAKMFHGKMEFACDAIRYTVELPGFDFKFVYKLYPDQQPKAIDLQLTDTSDKRGIGQTFFGIYILESDTLKICYNKTTRPTGFDAEGKSNNWLIALKRRPNGQF
ncbi:MAG: TIGR03067 domain-containing protein [Verrucomicrobiota bacterium]